ncbi:hypothetical protein KEJ47_10105 [Candidatus Bathyarchaeota archaeon]|nr:hypothetical protein [Candidatus Bathyarchaeota archaeon]
MPEELQSPKKEVYVVEMPENLFKTLALGLQSFEYEPQPNITRQWATLPKEIDEAFDKFCYMMKKKGRPISKSTVYGWIIKNWLKGSPFDEPKLAETAAKLKIMMKEAQSDFPRDTEALNRAIRDHQEQINFLKKAIASHEQFIAFLEMLKKK